MLLVAHETLHSNWRRVALVLIVLPLSIVKNAIRIVTLTMLATHVDPSFLDGKTASRRRICFLPDFAGPGLSDVEDSAENRKGPRPILSCSARCPDHIVVAEPT